MSERRGDLRRWAGLAAVAAVLTACAVDNPWTYNTPPTATGIRPVPDRQRQVRPVIVLGAFDDPRTAAVRWSGIGSGMTEALSRTLLNRGTFDVWVRPELSREVARALDAPTARQAELLAELRDAYPDVRYVVVGRVTDFHHTGELAPEVQRWQVLWRQNEAVVALDLDVVDLPARRVVVSDHVVGTHPAGRRPPEELYDDLAFGSYLFWSSPLGEASEDAIDVAAARLSRLVPRPEPTLRITRRITARQVELATSGPVAEGATFYVCTGSADGERVVVDPATGRPLQARVGSGARTALLLGAPPPGTSLAGARLRASRPAPPEPAVSAASDTAER